MASIDALLDFVMPKAPHLPLEMARFEIRQAAIRFCRKTGFDQRTLTDFNTTIGQPFYTLTPPDETVISEITSVSLDDAEPGLEPLRTDEIPADAETTQRYPEWYSASKNGSRLQLVYAPNAVFSVSVKVSVEPSKETEELADDLVARYDEAIACGALESILVMPKKPWTDMNSASYYKSKFDSACDDAKEEVDKGFTDAATRTRPCFGLR